MLGTFWAAFCRCSVLHCHCVSPSRSHVLGLGTAVARVAAEAAAAAAAAATTKVAAAAAYSRSRAAGRPCGHSCQELPRAGNLCSLTRVSEGTLGLVDYHCRAPFRPSVPWCFPVREVRFYGNLLAERCGKQLRGAEVANRSRFKTHSL